MFNWDIVEEAVLDGPEEGDLHLGGFRGEGRLFKEFYDTGPAVELFFGPGVEVGAELGEGGEFPELCEFEFNFTCDLFKGFDLGG